MRLNELEQLMESVNLSQKVDKGIVDDSTSKLIESITNEDVAEEMKSFDLTSLAGDISSAMGLIESVEPEAVKTMETIKAPVQEETELIQVHENELTVDTVLKFQAATPITQEAFIKGSVKAEDTAKAIVNKSLTESIDKYAIFLSDLGKGGELSDSEVKLTECMYDALLAIVESEFSDFVPKARHYTDMKKIESTPDQLMNQLMIDWIKLNKEEARDNGEIDENDIDTMRKIVGEGKFDFTKATSIFNRLREKMLPEIIAEIGEGNVSA